MAFFLGQRVWIRGGFREFERRRDGEPSSGSGRIDGKQLENAPTFLCNENRLGERAVGDHGHLFAIDLQNRAGFGAAGDDEDIAISLDLIDDQLRRGLVAFFSRTLRREDAESARRAPRTLQAVAVERRDPPFEGPLTFETQGGFGFRAPVDVDDVVDEKAAARDLEGVARCSSTGFHASTSVFTEASEKLEVVDRLLRLRRRRQAARIGEQVARLDHLLELPDGALEAGVRSDLERTAKSREPPGRRRLVVRNHDVGLAADQRLGARRGHAPAALRGVQVHPAVLHRDLLFGGGAGDAGLTGDEKQSIRAHRVERAVEKDDFGRTVRGGLDVVPGLQDDARAGLLPFAAFAVANLDAPLDGDELRLAGRSSCRRRVENGKEQRPASARLADRDGELAARERLDRGGASAPRRLELLDEGTGRLLGRGARQQALDIEQNRGCLLLERLLPPLAIEAVAGERQGSERSDDHGAPHRVH